MKRRAIISLAACALTVGSVSAQFLGGLPVFDATNFGNAIKRHLELQRQMAQLVLTYEQLILEYEHFLYMARQLPGLPSHRFRSAAWRFSRAANTYGTSGPWSTAINSGGPATLGYALATEPLQTFGTGLGNIPADQLQRVKTNYATVELVDAANIHGIEVLGVQRAKAAAAEQALAGLEGATLSTSDDMNTHIAVLNKINAASMMGLRAGQETNQLLVSLLEQQVTEAKRWRDAEAAEINSRIGYYANAMPAGMRGIRGTTQAIQSFRIP